VKGCEISNGGGARGSKNARKPNRQKQSGGCGIIINGGARSSYKEALKHQNAGACSMGRGV